MFPLKCLLKVLSYNCRRVVLSQLVHGRRRESVSVYVVVVRIVNGMKP